jgi:hypothetical protein
MELPDFRQWHTAEGDEALLRRLLALNLERAGKQSDAAPPG